MKTKKTQPFWIQKDDDTSPLVTTAIHDGHLLRPEVAAIIQLNEKERLREEDPYTGYWSTITKSRVIGCYSRFEVDLNRPREKAIYRNLEEAWGLEVYPKNLSDAIVNSSLERYDAFYSAMEGLLWKKQLQFGSFVVLDLHTYNHKRQGANGPEADPIENPEVNLGTATMLHPEKWRPLIESFTHDLRSFTFQDRHLDVRENIKFKGGHFPSWVHKRFAQSACVISIEFKKFFMNEWTGEPETIQVDKIKQALASTLSGIKKSLKKIHAIHQHESA